MTMLPLTLSQSLVSNVFNYKRERHVSYGVMSPQVWALCPDPEFHDVHVLDVLWVIAAVPGLFLRCGVVLHLGICSDIFAIKPNDPHYWSYRILNL